MISCFCTLYKGIPKFPTSYTKLHNSHFQQHTQNLAAFRQHNKYKKQEETAEDAQQKVFNLCHGIKLS